MCCFSRPVKRVSDTNIFARSLPKGRQFLVYSMRLQADRELAMILPLPTPSGAPEDALKFVNFEKYPKFFEDLDRAFPVPPPPKMVENSRKKMPMMAKAPLAVVEVGSFVASFVPTVADFDRLDEQFRLPTAVWAELPKYKNYGFAVFKLKSGDRKIHPMAFDFPRADPEKLFFPTVHIHDGMVKPTARFHHTLYCQSDGVASLHDWAESPGIARSVVTNSAIVKDYLDLDGHLYRKYMNGVLKNEDLLV